MHALFRIGPVPLLAALLLLAPTRAAAIDKSMHKPADTSSPRATLRSFLDSCNQLYDRLQKDRYFNRKSKEHLALGLRMLDCLDLSRLPEYDRVAVSSEAAICLKEALDRYDLPPLEAVPGVDEGEASPPTRYRIPGTRITIAQVEEGPQKHEYLFTAETVNRAVRLYRDVQSLPYREEGPDTSPGFYNWYTTAPTNPLTARLVSTLPGWFRNDVYGQAIWKWVGLLLGIAVGVALILLLLKLYARWVVPTRGRPLLNLLTILLLVAAASIPLLLIWYTRVFVGMRGDPLYVTVFALNLVSLLMAIFCVFGLCNRVAELIISSPSINPQGLDAQFVRILSRLIGVGAAVAVLLEGGHYLGIPIATLIASAGIGGLAIALAAQDTLRNLFGTIMLLTDKPFRVEDRIKFGEYDGVVEEIGLRSTRLRLLNGHLATIPNDELARNDIENVSRRPFIRQVFDLRLALDTSGEKLSEAIEITKQAVRDHRGAEPDRPPRVHLVQSDLPVHNLQVIYWYAPPDYWDCLSLSEELQLKILERFEQRGIELATRLPLD